MKICTGLLIVGCLAALASCSNPVEEHRLTTEQLAWQGYQDGQVLRFAQRPAGPVRTYRITGITDQMERQYMGINFTIFPSKKVSCQHLTVNAQRTDTTTAPSPVLDFRLNYDQGMENELWATVYWERFYGAGILPLEEINKGLAFDTVQYQGVKLLPAATFGGVTYAPVIRLLSLYTPPAGPTPKLVRTLYYAKGKGVVAFEETGGLWYRLP